MHAAPADRGRIWRLLHSRWAVLVFALLLGFIGQGSRGLWESDEGRYTQVAMQMLRSGDWVTPQRHHHRIHPTKPPLTYWAIAGSVQRFGRNEWAVRAPNALAFALTALCLFAIGRRLLPQLPGLPAAIYATTALPFFATNLVTTDSLLTAFTTLGVCGFVAARWPMPHQTRAWPWVVLMWTGFALAFMTKGPPALLPLLALLVFDASDPGARTRQLFDPRGLLVFLLLGCSWYLVVVLRNPGLMNYLVNEEVIARVASDVHGRYPQWWGAPYVYGLTILLGTLPWWLNPLRTASALPTTPTRWRALTREGRLLACWVLLPLLVFTLARSRLPLYLLPLFPAFALIVARVWLTRPERLRLRLVLLPVVALAWLAIKLALAAWPSNKDMRSFAAEIRAQVPFTPAEVVFIEESPRYGLGFYLDVQTEWVSLSGDPDQRYDDTLEHELSEGEGRLLFLMRPQYADLFTRASNDFGYDVIRHGESHRFVMASVRRHPAGTPR
jgi:4-amino-4-deoxy-L-arabinose transferase-like glycosyltransferase